MKTSTLNKARWLQTLTLASRSPQRVTPWITSLRFAFALLILLTLGVGNMLGTDITLEITVSSFGSGTTDSYAELSWSEDASDGTTISGKGKVIKDASAIRFKSSLF